MCSPKLISRFALIALAFALFRVEASIVPVPEKVPCAIADKQDSQVPDRVQLKGWIGTRMAANEGNRLAKMDLDRLLEGYRKRPGRQTWDGEHVGKWLHAATLAWVNTGDTNLRQRLDYVASELVKCQLPNGYLGTYAPSNRWTEWDVWAHKYNLIGLVTYMRYTGNMAPLPACQKMADLLCDTFGDTPGKRDIIEAGFHKGMAPTSVLEPMVLLYRLTGEPRYLEFCKYILRSWEQPNGPKIISTLLTTKRVQDVGDAKAYEMLSCLNGALEYYRTVGDDKILPACLNAWQDIVEHHLYVTGASSYREHYHGDFDLPNVNDVGETCVTVTWEQFNAQLLRLTGEARFAEQLERVVLNQLFGAEKCDGTGWGYYVQMEGRKPYTNVLDGQCCLSSGPRGVALIPTFAISTDADGAVVNLYEEGTAKLMLRDGTAVTLTTSTRYPSDGHIQISVAPESAKDFAVKLRIPKWCADPVVQVNGRPVESAEGPDGYVALRRNWTKSDRVELQFKLEPRLLVGTHKNEGKVAVFYGPLVLAADQALVGLDGVKLSALGIDEPDLQTLHFKPEPAPQPVKSWSDAEVFSVDAVTRKASGTEPAGHPERIRLIPFADAGQTGTSYKVWLPCSELPTSKNLLLDGLETRSRKGNVGGSVIDGDVQTIAVTYNGKAANQDWYAVSLDEPATVERVVFFHGQTFHDGGWFDASQGKPRVQVKTSADGSWENAGKLDDYPDTTATSAAGLKGGEQFTCTLRKPMKIFAIRVIGKPASGDNARQSFSSCGELEAFSSAK